MTGITDKDNKAMKIAVLGGSGFIGMVLVRQLLDVGHEVEIFDIAKSTDHPDLWTDLDVRDRDKMNKMLAGFDVIYNLAAVHRDDAETDEYFDVNVHGAENTVTAAQSNGIKRIIFTSSVALYGLNVGVPDESFTPRPFNAYGQSKAQAETVFNDWAGKNNENSLSIIRPVVIFGPANRGNVYNLMRQIAKGKFLMIGNGKNKKSIGYVENVAAFLVHVLRFGKGTHLYNYADTPDTNMNDFVGIVREGLGLKKSFYRLPYWAGLCGGSVLDLISKITGRRFPISKIRIQKFCANTQVNSDKAHNSGFWADYTIAEGLRTMIESDFNNE